MSEYSVVKVCIEKAHDARWVWELTEVNGDTCWGFEYDIETAFDAVRAALNAEKVDE